MQASLKKITYIQYKLWHVISKQDIRLNINLYKMMVVPILNLCAQNIKYLNACHKLQITRSCRKIFKRFCRIPMNTPNKILNKMTLDAQDTSEMMFNKARVKNEYRWNKKDIIRNLWSQNEKTNDDTKWKDYPKRTSELLTLQYGRICIKCQKIVGQEHNSRCCEINSINLYDKLQEYQKVNARRRKQIEL